MHDRVLRYIHRCELMKAGDRVLVAVSGGADSVALLRVLLELRADLGIVVAVAHFNHRLRGKESDADESFVVDLARKLELDFWAEHGEIAERAAAEGAGLEATGRQLRYECLAKIAAEQRFDSVATAHTLDDQAETVLMKFLRGAGSRGLAGIYPKIRRGNDKAVRFVRPLLNTTRAEVEAYLVSIGQTWREDESNLDHRFRRNRVRHELLPLLEREYNPNLRQVLSELAEINRAEEEYWSAAAGGLLGQLLTEDQRLRLDGFSGIRPAVQRRLLKQWLERRAIAADFQHIEQLRGCALGDSQQVALSEGWYACARGGHLVLKQREQESPTRRYHYLLPVPGEVVIQEIGCILRVVPVPASFAAEADPGTLLAADLIEPEMRVRNWEPGDRYRPAYSGAEQKLKRLFAERKIPTEKRALWPVVLNSDEIVWVHRLPVADRYCWRPGSGDARRIECTPCR
jgi:tRNA(Ile)-lysidine synthase